MADALPIAIQIADALTAPVIIVHNWLAALPGSEGLAAGSLLSLGLRTHGSV